MDKEFFAELTFRFKSTDDYGPSEISQKVSVWDADAAQLLEMFHTIMIGAGFSEEAFQSVLASYLTEHGWNISVPDSTFDSDLNSDL